MPRTSRRCTSVISRTRNRWTRAGATISAAWEASGSDVAHGPLVQDLARRARAPRAASAAVATQVGPGRRRCGEAGRRLAAHPDLRQPRSPRRGHRSARPHGASGAEGARARLPGPQRGRPRHRVPHRQPQRCDQAASQAARHHRAAPADLLRQHRRGVRPRLERDRAPVAAGPLPGGTRAAALLAGGEEKRALGPHDGRGPRALPCDALPGAEALLARGRRQPDPAARRPDPDERRARRRGHRHRHGAPRPAERAGERARQGARGAVLRVRGQLRPDEAQGLGRRQVPQGLLLRRAHAGRQRARRARLQSVAPRGREPGGRGLGARAPGAPRRRRRATR